MTETYFLTGNHFEAARRLPDAPDPRCRRWHGHSFQVAARSTVSDRVSLAAFDAMLADAVSSLHYHSIHAVLDNADDVALARFIINQLPTASSLWLRSAPHYGVMLDEQQTLIWLGGHFEAAHQLPHVPPGHQCGRLHGHRFDIRLVANAEQTELTALEAAWRPLHQQLHHRYLNTIEGLANPTSEVIAAWLFTRLSARITGLMWVEVYETHTAGSQFDGHQFRIWKEHRFESATPFDATGHYTGHSYLIRLMLSGHLDHTMGWIKDFGDVKTRFAPIYRQLDHHPLDQLTGCRDSTSLAVAHWVYSQMAASLPELARIDLIENPQRGVSLCAAPNMDWPLFIL